MEELDYVEPTVIPRSFLEPIGLMIVQFGAADLSLNELIWHLLDAGESVGRLVTGSIPNYRPRTALLIQLANAKIDNIKDRKKIIKLANAFTTVADYRHRVVHDEVDFSIPIVGTVVVRRAVTNAQTDLSIERLTYAAEHAFAIGNRMRQYRTNSSRWRDDAHFPWPGKPPRPPQRRTLPPRKAK